MRVLVVDDNQRFADNVSDYLGTCDHAVEIAGDGVTAWYLATTRPCDVIVLDLALPGLDGDVLCRRLRDSGYSTPIIMLTARGELEERLIGIEAGADSYLVKPVALAELDARIRAFGRRTGGGLKCSRLRIGDLELDVQTFEVTRAGQPIPLARIDFLLLRSLMRASPAVVSRAHLETELWDEPPLDSGPLRTHIYRLRCAIDEPFATPLLHTVHGIGYRLAADDAPSP